MIYTKKWKVPFIAIIAILMLCISCKGAVTPQADIKSSEKKQTPLALQLTGSGSILIPKPDKGETTPQNSPSPNTIPVEKIILTDSNDAPLDEMMKINLGDQFQLKPSITPANATNKTVLYKLDADSAQKIDVTEDGLVTAKASGNATINVWSSDKKYTSVTFIVGKDSTITVNESKLEAQYQENQQTVTITKKHTGSEYIHTLEYDNWDKDWVTITKNQQGLTETFTIGIQENKSGWSRKAYLILKPVKKNAPLIRKIPIIQAANPHPSFRTQWIHSISHPADSDLQSDPAADTRYRTWQETPHTTWFNAKKLLNGQDSEMCWAMSTADLIHWWMKENEGNLTRLIKKNSIPEDKKGMYLGTYNRNSAENKSSVANIFRDKFINHKEGTALDTAVNWYLLGAAAERQKQSGNPPGPGIVKGIFNRGNLITIHGISTKHEFETMIKDALKDNHALAVQHTLGRGLHVVTVWGVEFDGADNITALWVSDSNVKTSQLIKFGVHYPHGWPQKINYAAKNDAGTTRITDVIIMKSGKEQFKNWLDTH